MWSKKLTSQGRQFFSAGASPAILSRQIHSKDAVALTPGSSEGVKIGIFLHAHYPDELTRMLNLVNEFRNLEFDLHVTISNPKIVSVAAQEIQKLNCVANIIQTDNFGRNFGPLFVHCRDLIRNYSYIIHAHGKKSTHSPRTWATQWRDESFDLLLNEERIIQMISLALNRPSIGLIYPNFQKAVRKANLFWGSNLKPLKRVPAISPLVEGARSNNEFSFPVGGMFFANVEALKPIVNLTWSQEWFPEERGQFNGTVQHGVERLIGYVCSSEGFEQVSFDTESQKFFVVIEAGK
jgi:lipopolysaccharide biosynthesis protein